MPEASWPLQRVEQSERRPPGLPQGSLSSRQREGAQVRHPAEPRALDDQRLSSPQGAVRSQSGAIPGEPEHRPPEPVLGHARRDVGVVVLHLQERDGGDTSGGDLTPRGSAQPKEASLLDLVDRRAVVHQAVGMLSVQLGVDLSVALLRLRAYAWSRERPISDVAADVVERRLRLDDSSDGTALGPGGPEPDSGPGRTIP